MQRFMGAALAVVATIGMGLAAPAPVGAASGFSCSYNAFTATVTINLMGAWPQISRSAAGNILVNSTWCGTAATVTNTDKIVVNGTANSEAISIDLGNGGFQPGFTNEAGTSDEIEFKIDLGGGSGDQVGITGTNGVDRIDVGQKHTTNGTVRRINLNSGESTGVDADVTLRNVEDIRIYGFGGNDVIRARGKRGSGPDPLTLPFYVYGGEGNDKIKGGDGVDHIWGDAGTDTVWGYGGPDSINLQDGQGGDVGYGGGDYDTWLGDAGDSWTQ